jgi:hypothetical protein
MVRLLLTCHACNLPRVHKMRIRHRPLVLTALFYIAISVFGVIGNVFWVSRAADNGHAGCFRADSLLVYVRCEHFPGAGAAASLLSLPWMQGQLLYGVVTGSGVVLTSPLFYLLMLLGAAILWTPLVYILWLTFRVARR